jgi:hyperosmotically inducible protein
MLALAVPSIGASACATTRPAGEQSDDNIITGRVGRRLTADPDVKRVKIDVDTINGVVTLRGKVDSQTQKVQAERIAQNTDGVRRVINELVVDAEDDADSDDDGDLDRADVNIKTEIGRHMSADEDVRRVNIDIDVKDGVVTLSGVVHNETERMEAERVAREVKGVREVKNDLIVEQLRQGDPEKYGKPDKDESRDN